MPGADSYLLDYDLDAAAPVASDAIVVSTQGKRDREALHAALATDADYVAFVGSRRKAAPNSAWSRTQRPERPKRSRA